jgi:hypothetical protein
MESGGLSWRSPFRAKQERSDTCVSLPTRGTAAPQLAGPPGAPDDGVGVIAAYLGEVGSKDLQANGERDLEEKRMQWRRILHGLDVDSLRAGRWSQRLK